MSRACIAWNLGELMMYPDDRLQSTPEALANRLEALGWTTLAQTWRKNFSDHESGARIHVAFIGEFNHGKSTVINALIGRKILPSGMTPTTQVNTFLSFGASEECVKAYIGGVCAATWPVALWSRQSERLSREIKQQGTPERLEVHLSTPSPFGDAVIIDTPGLNEAVLGREQLLASTLAHADIVIVVLDANQALTRTELEMMRLLAEHVQENRRILIINKCDRLDDDERLEICHYVEQTVAPVAGDGQFYMLSARNPDIGDWQLWQTALNHEIQTAGDEKEAYAARTTNFLLPAVQGLTFFSLSLHALPEVQRDELVKRFRNAPPLSPSQLSNVLADVQAEDNRLRAQAQFEIDQFCQSFERAMPRELDKATLDDITEYFDDFIGDVFGRFAESLYGRLLESFEQFCLRSIQTLTQDESFPAFESALLDHDCVFEHVRKLIAHPLPTGAYDSTAGILAGVVGQVLIGRMERPVRDRLKSMSLTAIRRSAQSYRDAFDSDIASLFACLSGCVRELGVSIKCSISEMVSYKIQET